MSRTVTPSRRTFIKASAAATGAAAFGAPYILKGAAAHTIRIASLAPVGSSWGNAFKKFGRELKAKTDGAVQLKAYLGGSMGDEGAMVRKMGTGQLHAAAMTSAGLGKIDPNLLVLQLPMLFKTYAQLDKTRAAMRPDFDSMLEKQGFKHLMDGDVGWLYLFTNTPVATADQISNTKIWSWKSDALVAAVMKANNVKNAVNLEVPDVLAALETGMIDAFLASPYAAVALQWYQYVTHVTNLRLAMAVGSVVLKADVWDALGPDNQKVFKQLAAAQERTLIAKIRNDNKMATNKLAKLGMKAVKAEQLAQWKQRAAAVREAMTGGVFKTDVVNKVMSLV